MLKILTANSQRIFVGLLIPAFFGCAPSPGTSSRFQPPTTPKVQKGMPPQPQVTGIEDQTRLAFNELGFLRESATLAVYPPARSTQDGCVQLTPLRTERRVLVADYDCLRASDLSDRLANQLFENKGSQLTTFNADVFDVDGQFTERVLSQNRDAVLAQASLTRHAKINAPVSAQSSSYVFESKTQFLADVPEGSKDQPESWTALLKGSFTLSTSQPLQMSVGSVVTLTSLPQTEASAPRPATTLSITATSPVWFISSANCLRPVGTFTYTYGSTSGTLKTDGDGYLRDKETTRHSWGARCLER